MSSPASASPPAGSPFVLEVVIPIYKREFNALERFSIAHSLQQMPGQSSVFVHPDGLDLGHYREHFSSSRFLALPAAYFASHGSYNQLCYEAGFYAQFGHATHMLLLQPDAIVVRPGVHAWCARGFDFIGGPESHRYTYDIRGIPPFTSLDFLAPIQLHGCNGGLSLRRIEGCIAALQEFPELTRFFRQYGVGIGEDIFFSLMGRISSNFRVANEVTASRFALTDQFADWIAFNGAQLPLGFHAWYRDAQVRDQLLHLLDLAVPA